MALTPLIDLADAKDQLNDGGSADDAEIQKAILGATEIINTECGFSIGQSFTETMSGNRDKYGRLLYVTTNVPLLSIDSMTVVIGGTAVTGTATVEHPDAGVWWLPPTTPDFGPITVTYTAGRAAVPDGLAEACMFLVQWLWESQRGAAPLPVMGLEEPNRDPAMMGYPPQALHLMRPYLLGPRS